MEALSCWKKIFNNDNFLDIRKTIASAVINPQNGNEIIFTIKSFAGFNLNLFTLNTHNNTITTQRDVVPPVRVGRWSDANIVVCTKTNDEDQSDNSDNKNKLIIMGKRPYHAYHDHNPMFLSVLNLKTLIFEEIKILNMRNCDRYRRRYFWPVTMTGEYDEMLSWDCKTLYVYDWLFASDEDLLHIFYFDKNTNVPKIVFDIRLSNNYVNHGMVLLNNNKNKDSIVLLIFGGDNISFRSSFCLINISLKSLKRVTCARMTLYEEKKWHFSKMLDYTKNDDYMSYFRKNNQNSKGRNNFKRSLLKLEYKVYHYYQNVISFNGLDEISSGSFKGRTTGTRTSWSKNTQKRYCSFSRFSYNLVSNRYLLLTGGRFGGLNQVQSTNLMIYYDFLLNKWFELNKAGTFGKEKERLLTPLVCHCGLIINKKNDKNINEKWLYIVGSGIKINDCYRLNLTKCFCDFDWACERILWIAHKIKINKNTLFYRLSTDVLKYLITFC